MKFNWLSIVLGGLITSITLWSYTQFIQAMVQNYASEIENLFMGIPIVVGFFVYIVATILNNKFNPKPPVS